MLSLGNAFDENDLINLYDFCEKSNVALIPYGAGSSVVGGVTSDVSSKYNGTISVNLSKFNKVLAYVSENKFTNTNELNYIIRLKNYYTQSTLTKEQLAKNKNDLLKFVREIDRRRNKNFTNTFTTFINHIN